MSQLVQGRREKVKIKGAYVKRKRERERSYRGYFN